MSASDILSVAIGTIAVLIYVPLSIRVFAGKVKQNFATWLLWAILDGIAAATIALQDGNFVLPAVYALGSAGVTLSILRSKNFQWTWFETMVVCLVVVCLIVWGVSGARVATVASTLAVSIAAVPLMIEAWKEPWDQPFFTYSGFLVVSILAVIAGKSWTIEERLYPTACIVINIAVLACVARKFWIRNPAGETA